MIITCNHCNRQMTLPDEKVPATPFALTCPGCKGRIQVDPRQTEVEPETLAQSAVSFEPLTRLRDYEKTLMNRLFPAGIVANLSSGPADHLMEALRFVGMEEVELETDLETVAEALQEAQVSILLIALDKATAPPCEPLKPIQSLPLEVRRRTFVALAAPNVRSLDGQTAFYLQMNCLLSSGELPKIPKHIQRALLYHLRHYRYWNPEADE